MPEDFEGIVFDIGRGQYDHHQKDSRIRENGVAYASLGLLWEALGAEILGEELAEKFDESFVQPLDQNDNTGEKNELATLIGNFNPTWDASGSNDEAFFQAVSVAGMILENKFERYLGNERADRRVEEILEDSDFSGICTVSEKTVRDGDSLCDLSVQPGRILYPATEERIFTELQMQFSIRMAGSGK